MEQLRYLFSHMPDKLRPYVHPDLIHLQHALLDPDTADHEFIKSRPTLLSLKRRLQQFLDGLKKSLERVQEYQAKTDNLLNLMSVSQVEGMRVLGRINESFGVEVRVRNPPLRKRNRQDRNLWVINWTNTGLENSPLEMVVTPKADEAGFILGFVQSVNGVPLSSINRCSDPKCNRWFLQYGKRQKKFCSAQCRMRKANLDRRNKIRNEGGEAYKSDLESGRQRAKASYSNRMKSKLGPNVKTRARKTNPTSKEV